MRDLRSHWCVFYEWTLLASCIALIGTCSGTRCGDYLKGSSLLNGTSLIWPSDSSNYNNGERCIWLLEAQGNFSVKLVVNSIRSESGAGGVCNDYLEIRDGGTDGSVMLKSCDLSAPVVLVSTTRWMTVAFFSDQQVTSKGFNITLGSIYSGISSAISPVKTCQGFNMRCRNQVCVERGYLCDGLNDCGCTGPRCDEDACVGLTISDASMVGCGVAVGCISFLIVFISIGVLELVLKRRALAGKKREAEEEEKRKRRPKPRKRTVCLEDSLKLDVPPSRPITPQPPPLP